MFNTNGEVVTDCVTCADLSVTSSPFPATSCASLPDAVEDCPVWARSGCFVADTLLYNEKGELLDQDVYRGCSAFSWMSNPERCSKMSVNLGMGDDFTNENTQPEFYKFVRNNFIFGLTFGFRRNLKMIIQILRGKQTYSKQFRRFFLSIFWYFRHYNYRYFQIFGDLKIFSLSSDF